MHLIRQSTASTVTVGPVLDSTGAAVTNAVVGDFRISKNGTTATLSGATVTHDANGFYNIALTTGNTDTAGRLVLFVGNSAQSMGAHRFTVLLPSVFDALIANATNATGGLPTATAAISAFAGAISTLTAGNVRTELATELGRIDQTIGSRATQTSLDAVASYIDTEVAAIKAKTDNLPSDPADASDIATSFGMVNSTLSTIASYVDTEVAAIKAKTDLIAAFPANFNLLSITSGGAIASVINVLNVDELGAGALIANDAVDAIPPAVWNALATETYVDGSFGDRSLISTNNTREVAVTGSHHVAAVLHDAEPNSIPEDAFVAGALSARALAADAATKIATAVGTLQVLTRLDSMIESDGAGWQYTASALDQAPAGGGGGGTDWTANERTAIRAILGVPTSGTTPTDPTTGILDEIRDKTALITSGTPIQTSIPVTAQGQINGPLYIGDDYLTANGRSFDWIIPLPSGFVAGTSTCKFGMIFEDESGVSQFNLSGTVTDVGGGNVRLRFELPRATTGTLKAGFHRWSTEIVSAAGVEVTAVAYSDRKLVEWREKQT